MLIAPVSLLAQGTNVDAPDNKYSISDDVRLGRKAASSAVCNIRQLSIERITALISSAFGCPRIGVSFSDRDSVTFGPSGAYGFYQGESVFIGALLSRSPYYIPPRVPPGLALLQRDLL